MKTNLYKIYLNDSYQGQMEAELGKSFADNNFIFVDYFTMLKNATCILCGSFSHSWELGDTTHVELAKERLNDKRINRNQSRSSK